MDPARLAATQLARMRAMTGYYHRRFFADVRFTLVIILGLFGAGQFGADRLYLGVAPVALLGAAQTAFDASYLIFARQYAARLEAYLNRRGGDEVLVAARLENAYLFPLDRRKVVTFAFGAGFSWFGFMTALYTAAGIGAYGAGLAASWAVLEELGGAWAATYLVLLGIATAASLATGLWWFVGGEGERRLKAILDEAFGG